MMSFTWALHQYDLECQAEIWIPNLIFHSGNQMKSLKAVSLDPNANAVSLRPAPIQIQNILHTTNMPLPGPLGEDRSIVTWRQGWQG